MKTLRELLSAVTVVSLSGNASALDQEVTGLTGDSRNAGPGKVFVALRGTDQDGHQFAGHACTGGCLAVVVEKDVEVPPRAAAIRVNDTHLAYGRMAAELYDHPARGLTVIGLTGTNGKTTTSWIIENMLQEAGKHTGVIGTVNYRYTAQDGRAVIMDAPLTTPEPVVLQQLLRRMADTGVTHVIMEVSSHALAQQRLAGMMFDIGVFTNLSRDHLDYHHTMEEYFSSKCRLFLECLKDDGTAVAVVDPPPRTGRDSDADWGGRLVEILRENGFVPYGGAGKKRTLITCGFGGKCTVRSEEPVQNINGFSCRILLAGHSLHLVSQLIGRHNALNMLAAAGVGCAADLGIQAIGRGLAGIKSVPGRLERVVLPSINGEEDRPDIFVDYAHTPDALENVLQTLRQVTSGRLVCIFGCGGNRDRGKRPLMGKAAGGLADRIMVTSDNPRNEDPPVILREIEEGLLQAGVKKTGIKVLMDKKANHPQYAVLEDRRQAIHTVCSLAGGDDTVLIAGKGHETYQITAQGRRFFDDRIEARNGRLRWTVDHLLRATSGTLSQPGTDLLLGEISTDTRTLRQGDIFLALKGDNFNGHDFAAAAISKGASALVVSESLHVAETRVSVVRVGDTLRALGDLAGYRRQALRPQLLVVGITGSSGKTTVKEMTAAIFAVQDAKTHPPSVLKTVGNLNNLIGLPLSLLKCTAGHRTAVLEMGMNRPGEIKRLAEIAQPDIGCITNVQTAHLEGLGSIEGVARAKGELFSSMAGTAIRVVNYDDRHIRSLGAYHGNNVIGFAVTPAGRRLKPAVRATRISSRGEAGMCFTLHIGNWRKRIAVPATGAHNVANCAAAAAIAAAAGVDPEVIVRGLKAYGSGDKRLQISKLPGGIHVLNDAYNANPSSMEAALRTVCGFGRGCRRVAALGDMLELGAAAAGAHRKIGSLVAELGLDYLAVTGDFAGEVTGAARRAGMNEGRIMEAASTEEVADWVAALIAGNKLGPGDWLLVKGSRGMRMEKVLESLAGRLQNSR